MPTVECPRCRQICHRIDGSYLSHIFYRCANGHLLVEIDGTLKCADKEDYEKGCVRSIGYAIPGLCRGSNRCRVCWLTHTGLVS